MPSREIPIPHSLCNQVFHLHLLSFLLRALRIARDRTPLRLAQAKKEVVIRKQAISQKPGAATIAWLCAGSPGTKAATSISGPQDPGPAPLLRLSAVQLSLLLGAHGRVPEMAHPSCLVLIEASWHLNAKSKSPEKESGAMPDPSATGRNARSHSSNMEARDNPLGSICQIVGSA